MTPFEPVVAPTHADPAEEAVWAMELVLLVPRTNPPSRAALCAATGTAVVHLLANDLSLPGQPWEPLLTRWMAGRIRKHARRARTTGEWARAIEFPGVTATVDGATVRAFVPSPVTLIPRDIRRLQLSGSELALLGPTELDPTLDGPLIVSIAMEPALSLGKAAAAAGHAAQLAWMRMPADRRATWARAGYPVAVEHPSAARWRSLQATANIIVKDAGFTEITPGTVTSIARWL